MSTKGIPAAALRFLSTPSARRATMGKIAAESLWRISIHALREEGDPAESESATPPLYFYPRPPRGGRQQPLCGVGARSFDFYPRPPRGGRQ